jgi:hypothetical protein
MRQRAISTNWTGSAMNNPLLNDYKYEWKDNSVFIKGSDIQCEGLWEKEIYSASAAYICQNGGDILQIGYGMCQLADHIQSHSINSHTIIIDQAETYEKAQEWVKDKPNTTIITGSFYEMDLPVYDGIFINKTKLFYCNKMTARVQIKNQIPQLTKTGSLISWYNTCNDGTTNILNVKDIEYEYIKIDNPPTQSLLEILKPISTNYYVPKMKIK